MIKFSTSIAILVCSVAWISLQKYGEPNTKHTALAGVMARAVHQAVEAHSRRIGGTPYQKDLASYIIMIEGHKEGWQVGLVGTVTAFPIEKVNANFRPLTDVYLIDRTGQKIIRKWVGDFGG